MLTTSASNMCDRSDIQLRFASRRERWLAAVIFLLMIFSFFLHLTAFGDVYFKLPNNRTQTTNRTNSTVKTPTNAYLDSDLLPFLCILTHLIWTIVPVAVLDPCCPLNWTSLWRVTLKLIACTLTPLLCTELSISFVIYPHLFLVNPSMIISKWLVFLAAVLVSFWTGTLSDKNKWRGIHGGQIAPEQRSPLYRF